MQVRSNNEVCTRFYFVGTIGSGGYLRLVGSYRLLASTISTRDAAKTHDNALMQLQRALTVINRDLAQTVSRPIRDEYGDSVAAVVLKMNSLELTRIGVPNPLKQVRSDGNNWTETVVYKHSKRFY